MDDFDIWNNEKKKYHTRKDIDTFHVNAREIRFCALGKNIGAEENGKKYFTRPVLVIKKVGSLFFVVPLTSQGKESIYTCNLHEATFFEGFEVEQSKALLSQAKVIDKKIFLDHIGYISKEEFTTIKKKLTALLL